MMLDMNLQLFGGRGGSGGSGFGGGTYSTMRGANYEGNFVPEDERDAQLLQNIVELRERWGRKIGSNDPNDHLVSRYWIEEIKNGKRNREMFIGTKMQFSDELNRRNEANGKDIKSSSGKYSVTGWEDRTDGGMSVTRQFMDKLLDGPSMRKAWKKGKVVY